MSNALRTFLRLTVIAAIPFLVGAGGLLSVCHMSALDPQSFLADGQCHASDKPSEVFTSFLMLGAVMSALLTAVALVTSFVNRRYLKGKI